MQRRCLCDRKIRGVLLSGCSIKEVSIEEVSGSGPLEECCNRQQRCLWIGVPCRCPHYRMLDKWFIVPLQCNVQYTAQHLASWFPEYQNGDYTNVNYYQSLPGAWGFNWASTTNKDTTSCKKAHRMAPIRLHKGGESSFGNVTTHIHSQGITPLVYREKSLPYSSSLVAQHRALHSKHPQVFINSSISFSPRICHISHLS